MARMMVRGRTLSGEISEQGTMNHREESVVGFVMGRGGFHGGVS